MVSESTKSEMEKPENQNLENAASSLNQPCWSVATYESVAVSNLTYAEALDWVQKLDAQKISGLCIITDEAAARIV